MLINTTTQQVFTHANDIRHDCPNVSFPLNPTDEMLLAHGYAQVTQTTPAFNEVTETATELAPAEIDGVWTQQWDIQPLSPEQIAANKAAIQLAKTEAIKAHRDKLTTGGVKVGTEWFHSDTFSRTQQLGLVMMGAGMPAGIQWKTMDATFVTMTPTLAGQIFQATATSDSTLFAIAEAKRVAMVALDDPTAYDVSTGWPESRA